jgi:hypothetical protein
MAMSDSVRNSSNKLLVFNRVLWRIFNQTLTKVSFCTGSLFDDAFPHQP